MSWFPTHIGQGRFGAVLLLMASWALAQEPKAVSVGAGSYAEFPPSHEDYESKNGQEVFRGHIQKAIHRQPYIDPSQNGKPIPTNDWWTTLITEKYGGNLWAYPFMWRPDESGFKVCYPTEWNKDGNNLEPGPGLLVRGELRDTTPEWILLADFEADQFPQGWEVSGEAFGKSPTQGAVPNQTRVRQYLGSRLANSIHEGDRSTGTLTSPQFRIERDYLHFLIGGGEAQQELRVELLGRDNQVLESRTGDNSETLKWCSINVAKWRGQFGRIRVIDQATGGWGHILVDHILLSNQPTPPLPGFHPQSSVALRWGDWTVTSRLADTGDHRLDVTFGRGLPYLWVESTGVVPTFRADSDQVELLDAIARPVTFPFRSDALLVRVEQRIFGIFSPEGGIFEQAGDVVRLIMPGGKAPAYFVITALPDLKYGKLMFEHAFAIPRDSRFEWTYSPDKGNVSTRWTLTTQALRGSNLAVLQGWLPHHYRGTLNQLALNGPEFQTPRGKLKCAAGTTFAITWPFLGIPAMLPAPSENPGEPHPWQKSRMDYYLNSYVEERTTRPDGKRYGNDTYWGAKDLIQYAEYAAIASLTGNEAAAASLKTVLREALADWFTYTPGEKEHYFARYDGWKALVGFNPSYGSEEFTDNHFHYGYFTLAAALAGLMDPGFLKEYGPMARLVAKQYANWDRNDTEYPFLRTFDPWAGHSYAGGSSSTVGNNQESSSEAMQSWTGLFLLGAALKDADMTAAGAMGWAIERSAIDEYWNDYYGWKEGSSAANFSPAYGKTIVGILGDQGMAYGTFFHGHPKYIYGIQWLPLSTGLYYLGRDPEFGKYQLESMLKDQTRVEPDFTFSKLGDDWGDITLGFQQFSDPAAAAQKMDELWDANDPIAKSRNIAGITYYFTHADRALGPVAWDYQTDLPMSLVFQKSGAGSVSVVATVPGSEPVQARLFRNGKEAGTFEVKPGLLNRIEVTPK